MSYKLWVAKICMILSVLVLLAVSLVFYFNALAHRFSWELYLLSALLQIFAGFLLGVTPEVFLNGEGSKFSLKDFFILAIIPTVILIDFLCWVNGYGSVFHASLWNYDWFRATHTYYPLIASIWLGTAIGKAIQKA